MNRYITAREITQIIPLSCRHVAERVTHRKDFPAATRIGSKRFWKEAEILRWLEDRKEK